MYNYLNDFQILVNNHLYQLNVIQIDFLLNFLVDHDHMYIM